MSFFQHKYTNPEEVANLSVEQLESINPLKRKQIKTLTMNDAIVELKVQQQRVKGEIRKNEKLGLLDTETNKKHNTEIALHLFSFQTPIFINYYFYKNYLKMS